MVLAVRGKVPRKAPPSPGMSSGLGGYVRSLLYGIPMLVAEVSMSGESFPNVPDCLS